MANDTETTLGALGRGLVAGLAGTGAMTLAQTLYYKSTGAEESTIPAEVGKRVIRGVLQREVSEQQAATLNPAMHWLYGTSWGALYGLAARKPSYGVGFAFVVWGASLLELPAMKLAPPVWKQPPGSIASDLGFHLIYGATVAGAHRALGG